MANYFIKLEDGPDVRRKILESSKSSLQILRMYQKLLSVREQKLATIAQLRRELKELSFLLAHAESLMPVLTEQEIQEMTPKKQPKQKEKAAEPNLLPKLDGATVFVGPPTKKTAPAAPVPPPIEVQKMTELERLEEQLAAVEKKLSRIE